MKRSRLLRTLLTTAVVVGLVTAGFATAVATAPAAAVKTCSSGYVHAIIGGQEKCLRAGEFCSTQYESQYESYGFTCLNGRLETKQSTTTAPTTTTAATTTATTRTTTTTTTTSGSPPLGKTVLLQRRSRTHGCRLGPLPDRRCSPGAHYSKLTKAVICSASFHTGSVRSVPQSEKYAVEREYGLGAKLYGRSLEIDHIVSLELGGSNDIANLYPEEASFANGSPGYHVKDGLENKLHSMVCAGQLTLSSAQHQIAASWEKLYRSVYGRAP